MSGEFDIGPLTWVRGEIDQALDRSRTSLRAYAANPAESNQIKFAQTHFHQAHGALQIVGLDGVTRLSEELEGLLAELEKAGGTPAPETVKAAEGAYAAISAYLDELLTGGANQPLTLFAVYRDLVAARGKGQADPIDLYFPDLSPRPARRDKPVVNVAADALPAFYRDARGRYQRGLLKWIKKDPSGAEDMRAAIAAVEGAQTQPAQRAFWWVALGFFDALVAKALPDAPAVARLANRIEQQVKRMAEGSAVVAERLMREVLFAVARARPATEHLREVHEIYGLAGSIPAAFELRPDAAPQHPALRALRDTLPNAKVAWNKAASGHQPSLAAFREQAASVRDRAAELNQPHLARLAAQLADFTAWLGDDLSRVVDAVAMEVATALLLVENAVENFTRLAPEFAHQADTMGARLAAVRDGNVPQGVPEVPLLDEMSRRAQERLLMAQVVAEIQTNLRTIEQALDAFFRDPAMRAELAGLDKPVRQVLGALTMLNEDRAAAALAACGRDIQRFAAEGYAPAQDDFERVAGTLSGLGFYVDALQHGRADFDAVMKPIAPRREAAPQFEQTPVVAQPSAETVEAELEKVKKELPALYEAWKLRPDDAVLKEALKSGLAAIQKDAGFVANAGVESRAGEALAILATSGVLPIDPALVRSISAIAPNVVATPGAVARDRQAHRGERSDRRRRAARRLSRRSRRSARHHLGQPRRGARGAAERRDAAHHPPRLPHAEGQRPHGRPYAPRRGRMGGRAGHEQVAGGRARRHRRSLHADRRGAGLLRRRRRGAQGRTGEPRRSRDRRHGEQGQDRRAAGRCRGRGRAAAPTIEAIEIDVPVAAESQEAIAAEPPAVAAPVAAMPAIEFPSLDLTESEAPAAVPVADSASIDIGAFELPAAEATPAEVRSQDVAAYEPAIEAPTLTASTDAPIEIAPPAETAAPLLDDFVLPELTRTPEAALGGGGVRRPVARFRPA